MAKSKTIVRNTAISVINQDGEKITFRECDDDAGIIELCLSNGCEFWFPREDAHIVIGAIMEVAENRNGS